jgi:hypothetical protein
MLEVESWELLTTLGSFRQLLEASDCLKLHQVGLEASRQH